MLSAHLWIYVCSLLNLDIACGFVIYLNWILLLSKKKICLSHVCLANGVNECMMDRRMRILCLQSMHIVRLRIVQRFHCLDSVHLPDCTEVSSSSQTNVSMKSTIRGQMPYKHCHNCLLKCKYSSKQNPTESFSVFQNKLFYRRRIENAVHFRNFMKIRLILCSMENEVIASILDLLFYIICVILKWHWWKWTTSGCHDTLMNA